VSQPSTALITGATKGIGLAVTNRLAAAGHRVFVCSRNKDDVAELVDQLRGTGYVADGLAADVTVADDVRDLVEAAVQRFGPIRVLVNNAGKNGGGVTAQLSDELWDDVLATNLTSVFRMSREVLARGGMTSVGNGRIINVASTAGKQGVMLAAPYCASKHGVIGFTKALAFELAEAGITVNAVCPGYVETPMAQRVRQGYAAHWGISEEDVLKRFEAKIPLKRYSTPDEVAGLIEYLTTDVAASITAQALNVCGGLGNY
jgi:ketoreductase